MPLLTELRQRQSTPAGRAKLRERVGVEYALANIGHCHVIARQPNHDTAHTAA